MKRSDFLAIIGALPFFRKKVQKKIPERYLAAQRAMQFNVPEAQLQDYNSAVFTNLEDKQRDFLWFIRKGMLTQNEIRDPNHED
jgi:hypothetical protein